MLIQNSLFLVTSANNFYQHSRHFVFAFEEERMEAKVKDSRMYIWPQRHHDLLLRLLYVAVKVRFKSFVLV